MTFILALLKLAGKINISWWVVFLPMIITVVMWLIGWVSVLSMRKRKNLD